VEIDRVKQEPGRATFAGPSGRRRRRSQAGEKGKNLSLPDKVRGARGETGPSTNRVSWPTGARNASRKRAATFHGRVFEIVFAESPSESLGYGDAVSWVFALWLRTSRNFKARRQRTGEGPNGGYYRAPAEIGDSGAHPHSSSAARGDRRTTKARPPAGGAGRAGDEAWRGKGLGAATAGAADGSWPGRRRLNFDFGLRSILVYSAGAPQKGKFVFA